MSNNVFLMINKEEFCEKINERIKLGEELTNKSVYDDLGFQTLQSDFTSWDDYNSAYLKHSFNTDNNEYIEDYDRLGVFFSSYELSGQIEEEKRQIKDKIDRLKRLLNKIEFINNNEKIEVKKEFSNEICLSIHPKIYSHISKLLNDGHYSNAVEESFKVTKERLKELTGKEKAHEAFKGENYDIIFKKRAENEAEEDFFEGIKFLHFAIQKFRNEKSHTLAGKLEIDKALHYIALSSLALYLID